jgi:hypothetical protein
VEVGVFPHHTQGPDDLIGLSLQTCLGIGHNDKGAQSGYHVFHISGILFRLKLLVRDFINASIGPKSNHMQIAGIIISVSIATINLFTDKSEMLALVSFVKRLFIGQ